MATFDPRTVRRILLADDDEPYRVAMARSLRRAGYAVTEADDGLRALELVKSEECGFYDAVIMDHGLGPGLTGGEAANLIREHCPEQPVLFMSGYLSCPFDLREHEEFLSKPALTADVIGMIQKLFRGRATLPPAEEDS